MWCPSRVALWGWPGPCGGRAMGALAQQPKGPAPGRGKLPASFRSSSAQTSGHSDALAAHLAGFLAHISSSAAVIHPESHNSPKTGIFIFIVQQGSWAGARRVAVWGARPGNKATLGSGPSTTLPPPPPCVSRRRRLLRSHRPECRRTWEGLQPGLGRPCWGARGGLLQSGALLRCC